MKISIAVPSYNYARFLEACLGSIKQQDYINYEVLIADGGSDDGSLEIIRHYCDEDDRFQLISTEIMVRQILFLRHFNKLPVIFYAFLMLMIVIFAKMH